jgi:glycosyltransferase involved in cell wall biosynthesis
MSRLVQRIAIDALGVLPEISGGGETYVKGIVRGLAAVAPERRFLLFVTPRNRRVFEPAPQNVEFCEVRINNRFRPWRVLYEQLFLPSRIRAWKADASFFPLNMMPLTMNRPGDRTVLTIHDASPALYMGQLRGYGSVLRTRVIAWMEKQSALRASQLITVSYFSAKEVSALTSVREHEIRVVSPGITSLADEVEGANDLRPEEPYVLLVGRSNKHKNFDGFIRAFAEARRRFGLRQKVVLAGPRGTAQPDIERAISESGLNSQVHVLGPVGSPELALLYSSAELFVLPSLYEGFGFPLLEALEFGLPCVATNCCSLPEVGADAVFYVRPDHQEDMVQALGKLLSNEELRRDLSQRGRLRAQQFSWEIAARMLLAICERISTDVRQ